ncbi:hypothetical protein Tco_1516404 [Tanacetum coccineum]
MSSSTHPIIILSDSNVEDLFSSTNTLDYTPDSPDYSPASPRNTSSDSSEDLSKDLLASLTILPFYDDPYMKVMQAYNGTSNESHIPPPRALIAPPTVLPPSPVLIAVDGWMGRNADIKDGFGDVTEWHQSTSCSELSRFTKLGLQLFSENFHESSSLSDIRSRHRSQDP